MGWTIVNDKSNFSIICTKLSVEFTDPLFKDLTIHPTLLLYSQARCLTFLKQQGFLDFQITNMGSFSPVTLAAAIPVSLNLLFFPWNTFLL